MHHSSIVLLALLLLSPAARAENHCDGTIQYDMNMCAGAKFDAADKAMNERYARLMEHLDPTDRVRLRRAQKAWEDYRLKLCRFETDTLGSVRPTIFAGCMTGLTELHIKYLDGQLNCEEGDLSCKGLNVNKD
jgi:uncharacterized protein YecT (DUF1311 family)